MNEKRDELAHTRIDALTEHVTLNNSRVEKLIDQHSERDHDEFTHIKLAMQRTEAEMWNAINDIRHTMHDIEKKMISESSRNAVIIGIVVVIGTAALQVAMKLLWK